MPKHITVQKVNPPKEGNVEDDIDFLCKSLGYFSSRDTNETAGQIFRLIVQEATADTQGIKSEEIARQIGVTRGAVVHHLNNFIETGIMIRENNAYRLRSQSLKKSLEEVRADMERIFGQMLSIAEEVDEELGYFYR